MSSSSEGAVFSTPSSIETQVTRLFDAPRQLVFDGWSMPQQIDRWWGPRAFHTTTHSMDFRVGGVWRFIMHGPGDMEFENVVTYTEVRVPERLSYTMGGGSDDPAQTMQVRVSFAEHGSQTMVTDFGETAEAVVQRQLEPWSP